MSGKAGHLGAFGPRSRIAVAIAASAFAAWVVIGAPGMANAARTRASSGRVVHVIEHAVTDTVVHSGGAGDVTGNLLTWHNKVYDLTDTKQVGTDQGSCVRIAPAEGSWECNWTTFLAGGQITVQGPYYDTRNSVLAITGGTGAYSETRGQMLLISRDGGTQYDFVFQLGR